MFVILSIKPKYIEAILKGEKKYEFRKRIFKRDNLKKALMYSTSPVKKVVGSFNIGEITENHPDVLWEEFHEQSGIKDEDFFKYYRNANKGFAIEIKNVMEFKDPIDPWATIPNFSPPQSFSYIIPDMF